MDLSIRCVRNDIHQRNNRTAFDTRCDACTFFQVLLSLALVAITEGFVIDPFGGYGGFGVLGGHGFGGLGGYGLGSFGYGGYVPNSARGPLFRSTSFGTALFI